jgi:hypothetical protein
MKTVAINMPEDLLAFAIKLAENETAAYKNWVASAVESNDMLRAKELVTKLRDHEALGTLLRRARREMNEA